MLAETSASPVCEVMLPVLQDVVQRVGSRGPLGDFAKALCARLAPQLIPVQLIEELLNMAQHDDATDYPLSSSILELLVDSAKASPSLFAGVMPKVCSVVTCNTIACTMVASILYICRMQLDSWTPLLVLFNINHWVVFI